MWLCAYPKAARTACPSEKPPVIIANKTKS